MLPRTPDDKGTSSEIKVSSGAPQERGTTSLQRPAPFTSRSGGLRDKMMVLGLASILGSGIAILGCGSETKGTSGSGGAGGETTSSSTGTGGTTCEVLKTPIVSYPIDGDNCPLMYVSTDGNEVVFRVPGWPHHPIEFDTLFLQANALADGSCNLEKEHTLAVGVGNETPLTVNDQWTPIKFNPGIAPPPDNSLPVVQISIPPQHVNVDQNLFGSASTEDPQTGDFCPGVCDNMEQGFSWYGSDQDSAVPQKFQVVAWASGNVLRDSCEKMAGDDVCPPENLTITFPGPTEDNNFSVKRFTATEDRQVLEVEVEIGKLAGFCTLPDEVELVYAVGDAANPPQEQELTIIGIPGSDGFRVSGGSLLFSHMLDQVLTVPKGKALYVGMRHHVDETCVVTCLKGDPADSIWGDTNSEPGKIIWTSLEDSGQLGAFVARAYYTVQ